MKRGIASFASRNLGVGARHPAGGPSLCGLNQPNSVQILIRNIDRKMTEEEVTNLFRQYGKVTSCDLVMDTKSGESKGFGFAEMPNMDESSKAISALNGKRVGSLALRVKPAANSTISKHKGKGGK
jgi:RNA recognition motif-containing protein